MKKLIIIVVFLIAVSGIFSCSKFDKINTDPNAPNRVTPAMEVTALILSCLQEKSDKSFVHPYLASKHIAWAETAEPYSYNRFGQTDFSRSVILTNIEKMIGFTIDINRNSYTGLGLFVRAYRMYYFSLSVGDIPYSEALSGEKGIIKPKYDTQKEVMKQVLADLDNADKAFAKARNFEGDPVFNGDVAQWRKVVNSFRLKVLMGLSKKVTDEDLKIAETFKKVYALPLLESSNDNFQLVFSKRIEQNYPFNQNSSREFVVVSSVVADTLKKLDDYRLFYYASPSAYALETGGLQDDDWNAYPGIDPSMDNAQIKALNQAGKTCPFNLRYTENETGEPLIRISYAEQNFIIAEAIVRGWITGDAKTYYENGIRAAMNFITANTPDDAKFTHNRKMDDSYIATYLSGAHVVFAGNAATQLTQIWQQKYILYFMQHPWDAYFEYRRTGYPVMPINPATTQNVDDPANMPLRWLYPAKEYRTNVENLKVALARQYNGLDKTNGRMWILQ